MVEFLSIELIRHLLAAAVFIHKQLSIGQVGIKLGDVGLGVGDVGCRAEVVGVIEEDVLVRGVGRHVAVTRLHLVGVFGLVPLPGRDDVCAMSVGVLEYARTDFGGHAPVADEIVFGETPARNAEYGGWVDGVVLRLVEGEALQPK